MDNSVIEYTFKEYKQLVFNQKTKKLETKQYDEVTLYFSLLHSGHALFEQMYGKSVISALASNNHENKIIAEQNLTKEMLSADFIQALASASYIKVDENTGAFHNNMVTVNEFKKLPIYNQIANDYVFIGKLMEMVMAVLPKEEGSKKPTPPTGKKKKKR